MTDDYKPMSAEFLKARGRCCQSSCLHCPYGFTLKRFGLQFEALDESFVEFGPLGKDENYHRVFLKGTVCAIIKVNRLFVLDIRYEVGFENQGLVKEVIESYFFY